MAEAPAAADGGTIVFEQPLNERMRTFLRLDFLYTQALYHTEVATPWCSRAAMSSLLDLLAIATRGDLRSEVLKELDRHLNQLNEYQSRADVDPGRLKSVMGNLARLKSNLVAAGPSLLQPLRESEFMNAIKHRSAIPGGTCEFDLPDYYYWLSQPREIRMRTFNQWLALLRPLCDAIAEVLWLTRQNGRTREEVAHGGTFNLAFDRDGPTPLQLLRISLPAATAMYPEISGSHHRCSVRFLTWNDLSSRPTQTNANVEFMLSCCT
jgi:cell division protein ZapD